MKVRGPPWCARCFDGVYFRVISGGPNSLKGHHNYRLFDLRECVYGLRFDCRCETSFLLDYSCFPFHHWFSKESFCLSLSFFLAFFLFLLSL